jgi:hypothetical protein
MIQDPARLTRVLQKYVRTEMSKYSAQECTGVLTPRPLQRCPIEASFLFTIVVSSLAQPIDDVAYPAFCRTTLHRLQL